MRLGFFTGTFDPPHKGHESLAALAIETLRLERFFVFVNQAPRHKPLASDFDARKRMAELLFREQGQVTVAPAFRKTEIVPFLRSEFPKAQLFHILGEDSYKRLPPDVLEEHADQLQFVVFPRCRVLSDYDPRIRVLDPVHITSSSLLRQNIVSGQRPDEIPDRVWDFINHRVLYRQRPE